MKKSKILSMFIVSTMLLAGCQSATDVVESVNTDSVTVSETTSTEESVEDTEQVVSETVSETTSIVEKNDVQVWAAAYAEKVYTELQSENGLTFENMYNPEYAFTVTPINIDEENEMLKMNADIAFIDIDFDGIPEMFLGCHGTSHSAHVVYNLNGEKLGVVHSAALSVISCCDGKMYFFDRDNWTKAEKSMPTITANYVAATDSYTVKMYENSKCVNTVEDVKEEEITQYYEEFMGVSLKYIQDNKTDSVVRVIGYLRVPDAENYTEADIEACISSLLQQYEDMLSESKALNATTPAEEYNIQVWSAAYAEKLYAKLKQEDTRYYPINCDDEISGMTGIDSITFVCDINSDKIPELFVGCKSTIGIGAYDIYTINDGVIGTVATTGPTYFRCVGGAVYTPNTTYNSYSWTKLCKGLPSIVCTCENDVYTATVTKENGTEQVVNDLKEDDIVGIYTEYLNVDLNKLTDINSASVAYVENYLSVPNAENYTKADIETCIASLLQQYIDQI